VTFRQPRLSRPLRPAIYFVRKELLDTIRAVHADKRRVPPEIATEIAEHVADDVLTEREVKVLRGVAGGK